MTIYLELDGSDDCRGLIFVRSERAAIELFEAAEYEGSVPARIIRSDMPPAPVEMTQPRSRPARWWTDPPSRENLE